MIHRNLLIIFFSLLLSVGSIYSQENKDNKFYRTIKIDSPFDSVYTKTIDFLQEYGYFILALDRESGFIQAKIYTPNKKILSEKEGERQIYNFIIRPDLNGSSKISLSIYLEIFLRRSLKDGWIYYDRDSGIYKNDNKVYDQLLTKLAQWL